MVHGDKDNYVPKKNGEMEIIDIASIYDSHKSLSGIRNFVEEHDQGFVLQVPLSSIGVAGEHLSIAEDLLEASYLGENLARSAKSISVNWRAVKTYFAQLDFEIVPKDTETMARQLWESAAAYDAQERRQKVARRHYSLLQKYAAALDFQTEFTFPELVDDYYANLVEGAYIEMDVNFNLNEIYSKFPERRFRYWKSAFGRSNGQQFYASTDGWIVPPGVDLQNLLKLYASAPAEVVFEQAKLYMTDDRAYLINRDYATHFPFGSYLRALGCRAIAINPDGYSGDYDWTDLLYAYDRTREHFKTNYGNILSYPSDPQYFIAEYGEVLLVQMEGYRHVFFGADKLSEQQVLHLRGSFTEVLDAMDSLAGLTRSVLCQWDQLDDERFEQLCYDIIYYNPKFDNKTIRKMGKSRSRDSGRDIEVLTSARPGYMPEKYIFQCKFMSTGSSLPASKLTGISDVVDQHGAQGYGIMTSGVIDATLYDKLDGIARNRKIKVETWSVLEIERFLSRNPHVKGRYFITT